MNIKVGDMVALKSGGPTMTVASVDELHGQLTAWCDWFDEKNKTTRHAFPVTSLRIIEED